MSEVLRTISFENGLTLCFLDQTNRYFGDFHRVCILARGELSLKELALSKDPLPGDNLDDPLTFEKKLERMGVAGPDLDQVKQTLIDDFLRTAGGYLSQNNFPLRLVEAKLNEKTRGRSQFFQPRRELP